MLPNYLEKNCGIMCNISMIQNSNTKLHMEINISLDKYKYIDIYLIYIYYDICHICLLTNNLGFKVETCLIGLYFYLYVAYTIKHLFHYRLCFFQIKNFLWFQ